MADIQILVFGFKYGTPRVNNFVDVSFLPNPGRSFGLNSVADERHEKMLLDCPLTGRIVDALTNLAVSIIHGKDRPKLGIGCSSGRHRSPIIAKLVAERLTETGYSAEIVHVDGE